MSKVELEGKSKDEILLGKQIELGRLEHQIMASEVRIKELKLKEMELMQTIALFRKEQNVLEMKLAQVRIEANKKQQEIDSI